MGQRPRCEYVRRHEWPRLSAGDESVSSFASLAQAARWPRRHHQDAASVDRLCAIRRIAVPDRRWSRDHDRCRRGVACAWRRQLAEARLGRSAGPKFSPTRILPVVPLAPANCGVLVTWSDVFRSRFEGAALKRIALTIGGVTQRGEAIVTRNGLEGGAVYALGPHIRSACAAAKPATLVVDLKPDLVGCRTRPATGEAARQRHDDEPPAQSRASRPRRHRPSSRDGAA